MSSRSAPEPSRWSLAVRLTLWYAASSFLLVLGATGFLYWALLANLDREDDEHLTHKVETLRGLLRARPTDGAALRREIEDAPPAGPYARFQVRIVDREGATLLESPGMTDELPADRFPAPAEEPGRGREVTSASGRACRLVAVRADAGAVVQVAF